MRRSSPFSPIAAIKDRKRSREERERARRGKGGRRQEAESSPLLHGPLHRSLSRLDVIKTEPRAGPPSRRLINCFVRDTSLFKRNWAPPAAPRLSSPLDRPAHPARVRAARTCLYSALEAAFFSGPRADVATRGGGGGRSVPPAGPEGPRTRRARTKKPIGRFATKSTDCESNFFPRGDSRYTKCSPGRARFLPVDS